jgi:hypothetical protein
VLGQFGAQDALGERALEVLEQLLELGRGADPRIS